MLDRSPEHGTHPFFTFHHAFGAIKTWGDLPGFQPNHGGKGFPGYTYGAFGHTGW